MSLLQTKLARVALESRFVVSLLKVIVPPLDRFLLTVSRGWLNTALQPVLLLRTVGAKSGMTRKTATLCMPQGRDLVVVGSNWGQEKNPAWVHNLRANPGARVVFRGYAGPVTATELAGAERDEVWQTLIEFNPLYERYQAGTSRKIPVIRLRRPG